MHFLSAAGCSAVRYGARGLRLAIPIAHGGIVLAANPRFLLLGLTFGLCLYTGSRTPIYRGGTFREHSGNGQEPLGNGGEQGTETARTNLWIDTQRIPAIDSSRRPGSKFSPYLITTFKTQKSEKLKISPKAENQPKSPKSAQKLKISPKAQNQPKR